MNKTDIKQVKDLKRLRIDITSFRDINFDCISNYFEHQSISNVIVLLYQKIRKIDNDYYGNDYI